MLDSIKELGCDDSIKRKNHKYYWTKPSRQNRRTKFGGRTDNKLE
jgi:hypothetical protein